MAKIIDQMDFSFKNLIISKQHCSCYVDRVDRLFITDIKSKFVYYLKKKT